MSIENPRGLERAGEVVEGYIVRTVERRRRQFELTLRKKQHSLSIDDRARVEISQGGWEDAITFFKACDGANGPLD